MGPCQKHMESKPGILANSCNPSTQETETEELGVCGQPELHSKTVSKTKHGIKDWKDSSVVKSTHLLSSGLRGHQVFMWYTYMHADKTLTDKINMKGNIFKDMESTGKDTY